MRKKLDLFLVSPPASLKEVMQKIDLNGHGIALVVNDAHKLLGLVTDGDIRRSIIKGVSLAIPIEEIMNQKLVTVKVGFTSAEVSAVLKDRRYIHHLPVVDTNNIVQDLLLRDEISNLISHPSILFTKESSPSRNKKILITGGAGYIGSILTQQLLEKGYQVTVLDKFIFGKSSLAAVKSNPHLTIIEGDVNHLEKVIAALHNVDTVVHLAEIVGDPACSIDPLATQQINYLSTTVVANACKHFQINRFIYASSCSAYGATTDSELLHEKSALNPLSLYARMKVESERAILSLADGLFSPTILRFATVFGESSRMRFDLVVNTLALKAFKEGKITIFGGNQWRPFIHVSDLARAITMVIEAPLEKVQGEIFNVGSNENNFTINQIGQLVKEIIPHAELITTETNGDLRNYRVDFSKIFRTLGFQPLVGVKQGIAETFRALQQGQYQDHQNNIYYNDRWYSQQLQKNG